MGDPSRRTYIMVVVAPSIGDSYEIVEARTTYRSSTVIETGLELTAGEIWEKVKDYLKDNENADTQ